MKWLNSCTVKLMLVGFIEAILFGGIELANGATITVGTREGSDVITIQEGIDTAIDGDRVLVAPGEYVISEPITFFGKAITVQSEAGPDETTIRMGTPLDSNRGSVVVFENGETTASILEGFTITGGSGSWLQDSLRGGGIFFDGASATVNNCAIVQNSARRAGGILCDQLSSPRLTNCIIAKNSSISSGGGLSVYSGSSMSLTNCIIRENSSAGSIGGGVVCWGSCLITLTDCTITGNSATNGGGIYCGLNSSATMTNCTIRSNSAIGSTPHVSGYGGGVQSWDNSSVNLTNCIIANNTAGLGGGAMFYEDSSITVTNCVMFGNRAIGGYGGAIESVSSSTTLVNCTITRNSAGEPGGGMMCWQGSTEITNSIFWANIAPQGHEISVGDGGTLSLSYSNVAGGQTDAHVDSGCTLNWGQGNIDADPYFVDPINEDFHLKSQAGRWDPNSQTWIQDDVTSPCIDAGDPVSDWNAELWPQGIRANMGAYGGTLQASRSLSDAGNIADLNRDRIVDSGDMCMMVDHWGTDEPYCDIAPAPFGDGIVDVQDLVVLAENLFIDYRMITHWKLDEIEGDIAYDSVGEYYGTLQGEPIWQPTEGKINGALQFDGIDDCVTTGSPLNPADGDFSVFVWVKGDTPGQVILSQVNAADWLCTDSVEGYLMTGLKGTGRGGGTGLLSQTSITDNNWHQIGFVWDGSYRHLYVDGVEVANDNTQLPGLISADSGLFFGTGCHRELFFSGFIDDVHIYKQALTAEEIAALAK